MSSKVEEWAERFVDEMRRSLDPSEYSEYNLGPEPDPVGALRQLAQEIMDEVEELVKP